MVSDLQSAED